jgi:hypothetical protein
MAIIELMGLLNKCSFPGFIRVLVDGIIVGESSLIVPLNSQCSPSISCDDGFSALVISLRDGEISA